MLFRKWKSGLLGLAACGPLAVCSGYAQSPFNSTYTFPVNAPGAWAPAGRVVDFNDLEIYGVTSRGGNNDLGTIYRIWNNGAFFTVLHSFNRTNGANPAGGLMKAL